MTPSYSCIRLCAFSILAVLINLRSSSAQTITNLVHEWSRTLQSSTVTGGVTETKAVAVDASGNLYVTGTFSGTSDFDPAAATQLNLTSNGGQDLFFAKYSSGGALVYAFQIGGQGDDGGLSVKTSTTGEVFLCGYFQNSVDFDPSSSAANLTSAGDKDIFIARYGASGNYVYAKGVGSAGIDEARSLAVDKNGAVYLTGVFSGTVDFDPSSTSAATYSSAGGTDIFIAKYNAIGNFVYANAFGGGGQDQGNSISIDTACHVYIAGSFESNADFDRSSSAGYVNSSGSSDIFFANYNKTGGFLYVKSLGSYGADQATALVADTTGIIYVTGFYEGSVDFDPSFSVNSLTSASSSRDIFIAKYSGTGAYVYARSMGGSATDVSNAIAIDANKSVYISGAFQGVANFNPPSSATTFTSRSSQDIFFAKFDNSGAYVFAKTFAGSYNISEGKSIAVDAVNQIYVGGHFNARVDFDPSTGVSYLHANNVIGGFRDGFAAKYSSSGGYTWGVQIGTHFADHYSHVRDIRKDNLGNIFVIGLFHGEIDFDPSAGTSILRSNSFNDFFIARYSAQGDFMFVKAFKNYGGISLSSLALDNNKNLYVAGGFSYEADFDGIASTPPSVTDQLDNDLFVAKYDSTGALLFANQLFSDMSASITKILVNSSGEIFICGGLQYVDFDPSSTSVWVSSSGYSDAYFAKYSSSGAYVYSKVLGGSNGYEGAYSMAMDAAGHLYLGGIFSGTADFDPATSTHNLVSAGDIDGYFARYNSAGNLIYAKRVGGINADAVNHIAVDANKNVYITGQYYGTADFDPAPLGWAGATALGLADAFFARYDSTGNHVYSKSLGGIQFDSGVNILVDNSGSVLLAGQFNGSGDFDPGTGTASLTSTGSNDLFICRYDASGNYVFAKQLGSVSFDHLYGLLMNSSGTEIHVAGSFASQLDADPNPSSVVHNAGSSSRSLFFVKLTSCTGPPPPVSTSSPSSQVLCSGGSTSLSVSGTGTISWYPGITSTVVLGTGNTLNTPTLSAGTHSFYVATFSTCNIGLRTEINVTVNPSPTINVTNSVNLCIGDSYTIQPTGADSYTVSGGSFVVSPMVNSNYSVTGTSSLGCEGTNTAVVNFAIQPLPTISVNSGVICSGKSFTIIPTGGHNYIFSGGSAVVTPSTDTSYSVTATSIFGCVSSNTAVSSVTVIASPTVAVNSGSICAGQVFLLTPSGALSYTSSAGTFTVSPPVSASYTVSGTAANGCSNSAVANLTVIPLPVISVNSGTICAGESFTISPSGAFSYSISGGQFVVSPATSTSYTLNGTSAEGCVAQNITVAGVTVVSRPMVSVTGGSVCSGNGFTLQPTGAASYSYFGGGPSVFPAQTTTYGVVGMQDGCFSTNTAVATVSVIATPTVAVNSGSICQGGMFTMVPTGAVNYTFSSGTATVMPVTSSTYTITGEASGCYNAAVSSVTVQPIPVVTVNSGSICAGESFTITPAGAATYSISGGINVVSPATSTNYTVTGVSAAGCTSTVNAISAVIVHTLPVISVNSGSICSGGSFTILPAGASSYSFSGGLSVVSPASSTNYSVVGFSSEGCVSNTVLSHVTVFTVPAITVPSGSICEGGTFLLTPQGAASYTFPGGTPQVSPVVTSTYVIIGNNAQSCTSSAVATVTVFSLPVVNAGGGAICVGGSFTIPVSGAHTYTSSAGSLVVAPASTTHYSITGTDLNGCISGSPAVVVVTVNPLPVVTVPSGTVCAGQLFTFQPSGAASYIYSSGSATVSPANNSTYTITGISAQGCSNIAYASVSVAPLPLVSVNNGTICAGSSFTLHPVGAVSYTFSSGSAIVVPQVSSVYTVAGTGPNGCVNKAVSNVSVLPRPNLTLTSSDSVICEGDSIQITLIAGGGDFYLWSTGDLTSSIVITPSVTTNYTVTGITNAGCSSIQTILQVVDLCTGIPGVVPGSGPETLVYPNPSPGQFIMECPGSVRFTVINSSGQSIMTGEFAEGKNTVDLKEYAKGLYLVRIVSGHRTIERKMIVQ